VNAWFNAFVLTQLVEIPIYFWACARVKKRNWRFLISALPTTITHPLLWAMFPILRAHFFEYAMTVVVLEIWVTLVEAQILRWFQIPKALQWSLLANAASVLIGLALRALGFQF
jgi:hypothetical protein